MSAPITEPSVIRRDLFGVPVATVVRPSSALGGASVKSAIAFSRGRGATQTVFGFGFVREGEALASGLRGSQYEALERLFSRPSLYGPRLNELVPVRVWGREAGMTSRRSIALSEVCLRPGGDSTGLAIHTERELAESHAVCELLERHLLGVLWYEASLGLARVPHLGSTRGGYRVECYVPVGAKALPLVLAVVTSTGEGLAFCGAALSPSVRSAASRATAEALMLLDGHLNQDHGRSNSPHSADRLVELGRDGREILRPLLQGASSMAVGEVPACSLSWLAVEVLGTVEVATAEVRSGLHLCRARSDAARSLPERRRLRASDRPLDPFC